MFRNAKIKSVNSEPSKYHSDNALRGEAGFIVSSSMLKSFLHCPSRWREGYESHESESKKFGSLFDCRLLTPKQFESRFAIKPTTYIETKTNEEKPWNANSNVCKAWLAENDGFEIISAKELNEVDTAIKRFRTDEILSTFIAASDFQVWLTGEWIDQKTGLTIPVKALLDIVPRLDTEFGKSLGDLKTVRSGNQSAFVRQIYQYGWHAQAAFYRDFYIAATGEDRPNWCFCGVENYAPWQPFRRLLSENFMGIGRATYQQALRLYAHCLKSGEWPGYDDHADSCGGWSLAEALPYMEFETIQNGTLQQAGESEENFDLIP